ncbi:MAG: bifunctional nuclease family protein [Humidesulfovibrio sp.]|uniref:bifunctional nuclease family protein n=1 Tax=Humidesulfovibrio sp. TaxID=2910988 RepID=UPI002735343D|nr:bifunctional nuclease family protein [Humidesulfovibrio sp.]MDP2846983.1 bifunctional nuclease family protein [Humidesulfovibrio sp.]
MVEMKIFGLAVDEKAQSPVLILKDESRDLALPIWVGPVEAMAISLAINAVETPRPMTHDLIGSVVAALSGSLTAVEVVSLREGTFYAELVLRTQADGKEETLRVDCRPSDAIALAARLNVPILVAESVLAEAGTRTLESAKAEFSGSDRDKWTDELENFSPDELKYKM